MRRLAAMWASRAAISCSMGLADAAGTIFSRTCTQPAMELKLTNRQENTEGEGLGQVASWLGAWRERARFTKGSSLVRRAMFFSTPTVDTVTWRGAANRKK